MQGISYNPSLLVQTYIQIQNSRFDRNHCWNEVLCHSGESATFLMQYPVACARWQLAPEPEIPSCQLWADDIHE